MFGHKEGWSEYSHPSSDVCTYVYHQGRDDEVLHNDSARNSNREALTPNF